MDEINLLMHGFSVALTPYNLGLMFVGVILGVLIGVLPGLGGANGVAILLPLTFSMNPTSAIIMLSCLTGARCSAAPSPRYCSISRGSRGRWPPPSMAIPWRRSSAPARP